MSKMLSNHDSKCKCVECAAIKPDQIVRYLDLVDRRRRYGTETRRAM